jgi:imidazolonepropionase-like amidohydrolase
MRKRIPAIILSFAVLSAFAALVATAFPASRSSEMVVVGGTLIDGAGGPPLKDSVILIENNRISRVGTRGQVKYSNSATVIDASGKFIIPGLIDIHAHYNDWMGEMFLAGGVTTIKDVGNDVDWIAAVSAQVEQGKIRGPRIFYVGNGLDTPPPTRDHFVGLTSPGMAASAVDILHGRGAVAIKVREHITAELLKAITAEAHKYGMPVTGHVRRISAYEAALAGIDGLEHASGIVQATMDPSIKLSLDNLEQYEKYVAERKAYSLIDPHKAAELVDLLVSRKVALIPTMSGWWRMATIRRDDFALEDAVYARNPLLAYVPEDVRKIWSTSALYKLDKQDDLAQVRSGYKHVQDILRRQYAKGGAVLAGSDTFVSIPGLSLQRELVFLVDSGFTPMQAITIATRDNARFLGKSTDLGIVTEGKLADLVVIKGDPLADIKNTQQVLVVIKNGQVMDTSYHADYSIPTPRPNLTRPLWIERQLEMRSH